MLRLKLISTGLSRCVNFIIEYVVESRRPCIYEYIVNNAVDSVHGGRKTWVVLFSVGVYLAKLCAVYSVNGPSFISVGDWVKPGKP